jgi:hypothetical protein
MMTRSKKITLATTCLTIAISPLRGADPEPIQWQYRTDAPAAGWEKGEGSAADWKTAPGGFGSKGKLQVTGAITSTEWTTPDIWIRRKIELKQLPKRPAVLVYHDEDAEVFINGKPAATYKKFSQGYELAIVDAAAASSLKQGNNVLAVHCHQTTGGQYIDAHLVDADALPDIKTIAGTDGAVHSDLITEWGEKVTPENAWKNTYPRPQLKRANWKNLNGKWSYAVTARDSDKPSAWGQILVPFCLESKLGGVQRLLQPYEALWYRRPLELAPQAGQRTLLNFEAVDYRCKVWVNGKEVGSHVGGNLPFSFDITDALKPTGNELTMRVEDDTEGYQQNGKQRLKAEGIFYTRVSGIWQTVWTEQVYPRHITNLGITTDIATGGISIKPTITGTETAGETIQAQALEDGKVVAEATGTLDLKVPNAKLWSPTSPTLYDLKITIKDASGKIVDQVESYTGIRKVGQVRDDEGNLRFTLNDKPIFHWGPLDQGWWPDGLLTPPSEDAIAFEIKFLKDSGFNMIRKHIKVEPRAYYHECDKMGMLVWQDQVSGGPSPAWTRSAPNPKDAEWPEENQKEWLTEFDSMITLLDSFPCIVVWTPFNEAWGQHNTMEVGEWAVKRDPSRLINIASGGNFWPVGNIADEHVYPDPAYPLEDARFHDLIKVVGEFGGHGWAVKDHIWNPKGENWGYNGLPKDIEEYRQRYQTSIEKLIALKARGISGGVYTQTTDVEGEINGLMTYDRKVMKIQPADLKKMSVPLTADR